MDTWNFGLLILLHRVETKLENDMKSNDRNSRWYSPHVGVSLLMMELLGGLPPHQNTRTFFYWQSIKCQICLSWIGVLVGGFGDGVDCGGGGGEWWWRGCYAWVVGVDGGWVYITNC